MMTEIEDAPGNWRSHSSTVFTGVEFPPTTPVEREITPGVALKIMSFYGKDVSIVVENEDPWKIGPHFGIYADGQRIARWRPGSDTASFWTIQESPEAARRFAAHISHP